MEKWKKLNMSLWLTTLLAASALSPVSAWPSSMVRVTGSGEYSRLTVRVSEEVPRQFCSQIRENLEVRNDENFCSHCCEISL